MLFIRLLLSCVLRISFASRATTLACAENVRSNNSEHRPQARAFLSDARRRKWVLFPFNKPWCYQICIANYFYSERDDLLENFVQNHGPRLQKVHFRLTCVSQKRRCLNSCSQYPWAWSYCTLANVASFHVLAQTELLKRLQFLMMACVSVFCAGSLTALINESTCRLLSIHWKSLKHESPIRIPR